MQSHIPSWHKRLGSHARKPKKMEEATKKSRDKPRFADIGLNSAFKASWVYLN